MTVWLDMMRIKSKVVEIRELDRKCESKGSVNGNGIYIVQQFNKLRVLIRDMFLHKRCSLEQLLASLATEPAFIFLLYILLGDFR